jgi:hypothetical protein
VTCGSCGHKGPDGDTRARAAACELCREAIRGQGATLRRTAVECGVSGLPVLLHATIEGCPKDRYADARGVVRWFGIEWYGVPYPQRVWLWALHTKHPKPSSFPGCGCLKWAKDAWENRHGRQARTNADPDATLETVRFKAGNGTGQG